MSELIKVLYSNRKEKKINISHTKIQGMGGTTVLKNYDV